MNREEVMNKILDSKDATVGGGSASALASAMAASLAGMVARLSAGKNLGLTDAQYIQMADRLDVLSAELVKGASNDAAAFAEISAAFKMPKSTGDEKEARKAAISKAGISAAQVPLNNAKMAKEVADILDAFIGKHNPSAESDLMIGRHFLNVALYGFALNILANLSIIKDEQLKNQLQQDAVELIKISNIK